MAPTNQASQDPGLAQPPPNPSQVQASQSQAGVPPTIPPPSDMSNVHLTGGFDQNQIMSLLRHLPNVFGKLTEQGPKEDAAQALSNLAAHPGFPATAVQAVHYPTSTGLPGINDPGPSSHPRGPPNLGQLSAVALQATQATVQQNRPEGSPPDERTAQQLQQVAQAVQAVTGASPGDKPPSPTSPGGTSSSGSRRRNPAMGSDEWTRQRKDNHKEVERRRRGNINEGINELGRIVPSGNGEKAKGAILARSVQYIHHLKENEARNIEKWTLEKLLMDQAMGDLQNQLEEVKRMWEEERNARQRLEIELESLRNSAANGVTSALPPTSASATNIKSSDSGVIDPATGNKRKSDEVGEQTNGTATAGANGDDRDGKRQRTD